MVRVLLGCEHVTLRLQLQIIYIDLEAHEETARDFIHAENVPHQAPCCGLSGEKNPTTPKKEKEGLSSSDNTNGNSIATCMFDYLRGDL